jgi:hypothetical protein
MVDNTSKTQAGCACGAAPRLIFACSGAADVGQISDLGMEKGKTPVTEEAVGKVVSRAKARLAS